MTRKFLSLAAASFVVLLFTTTPFIAHHSEAAQFDTTKPVKVSGVVKKVEYIVLAPAFPLLTDPVGEITPTIAAQANDRRTNATIPSIRVRTRIHGTAIRLTSQARTANRPDSSRNSSGNTW